MYNLEKITESKNILVKAVKLLKTEENNPAKLQLMVYLYQNLSAVSNQMENYEKSLKYIEKAYKYIEKNGKFLEKKTFKNLFKKNQFLKTNNCKL